MNIINEYTTIAVLVFGLTFIGVITFLQEDEIDKDAEPPKPDRPKNKKLYEVDVPTSPGLYFVTDRFDDNGTWIDFVDVSVDLDKMKTDWSEVKRVRTILKGNQYPLSFCNRWKEMGHVFYKAEE